MAASHATSMQAPMPPRLVIQKESPVFAARIKVMYAPIAI